MPRPAPRRATEMQPQYEAQDRERAAMIEPFAYQSGGVFATDDLDNLTEQAGLIGGWSALYAAAVTAGRRLPGHVHIANPPAHDHIVNASNPRLPLDWRAWALEHAPALIDGAAEQTETMAGVPMSWW